MKRNTIVFWLVLAVGLVLVALAAGAPPKDGTPLDPRATGPLGAKALVLTLGELGGDVHITPTVTGSTPPCCSATTSLRSSARRLTTG